MSSFLERSERSQQEEISSAYPYLNSLYQFIESDLSFEERRSAIIEAAKITEDRIVKTLGSDVYHNILESQILALEFMGIFQDPDDELGNEEFVVHLLRIGFELGDSNNVNENFGEIIDNFVLPTALNYNGNNPAVTEQFIKKACFGVLSVGGYIKQIENNKNPFEDYINSLSQLDEI